MFRNHILLVHSSIDGDLDCFHVLALVSNAAVNMDVQICLRDLAFNSLGISPEVELLGHVVVLFFTF